MISTQNQKRFTHRHWPIQICKAELSFSSAKKILNYHPFLYKFLEEQNTVLQRKAQKCQFFLRVVLPVLFFPRRVSIVLLSSQPTRQELTESRSNPPKKGSLQKSPKSAFSHTSNSHVVHWENLRSRVSFQKEYQVSP